ncbi:MAG: leucine-rich repeat domain-containing protein [Lachnospiraceae bacterium]|jgi:hypothetical protein|nr:leucine-rich repeat domain-containing protein [Lachnospiraceae bacterium]
MVKWRKGFTKKKVASVLMATMLAIPMLSGAMTGDMSKVSASATPSNPRKDSNGVVTWDLVYFGRYTQSNRTDNEAIKWRVLHVEGNDALLVADTNLDACTYENDFVNTTWELSYVRSWLNGYDSNANLSGNSFKTYNFIDKAFNAAEQDALIATKLPVSNNPTNNASGGEATTDKVFLLSYEDVTNTSYGFNSDPIAKDPARVRINTAYITSGGSVKDKNANSNWASAAGQADAWRLRTPGTYTNNALFVAAAGNVGYDEFNWNNKEKMVFKGDSVYNIKDLICPAIHLNLAKTKVWSNAGTVNTLGKYTKGEEPPKVDETEQKVEDTETEAEYVTKVTKDGEREAEFKASLTDGDTVVVPEAVYKDGQSYKVTSIAAGAFKNNKKLKTFVMGSNVKTIGKEAFSGCSNLSKVTIGKNVESIGDKAFYKCTSLKSIVIPASVKKIGKQAFFGCKKLKDISIKTSKLTTKNVGAKAFKGTHGKARIKVPKKKLKAYKKLLKSKGVSSKAKYKKL